MLQVLTLKLIILLFFQIRLFWEVFHELPLEEKKKFLLFLTGSNRIPIDGMKAIRVCSSSLVSHEWFINLFTFHIQITFVPVSDDKFLPVAHTCFNLLDLPRYQTKEKLKFKLLQAIQHNQGFSLVWMQQFKTVCVFSNEIIRRNLTHIDRTSALKFIVIVKYFCSTTKKQTKIMIFMNNLKHFVCCDQTKTIYCSKSTVSVIRFVSIWLPFEFNVLDILIWSWVTYFRLESLIEGNIVKNKIKKLRNFLLFFAYQLGNWINFIFVLPYTVVWCLFNQ